MGIVSRNDFMHIAHAKQKIYVNFRWICIAHGGANMDESWRSVAVLYVGLEQ